MISGSSRGVRWLVIVIVSLALLACAPTRNRRDRMMFDIGPHKARKLERIAREHVDGDAVAGFAALANYPVSKLDNWRAAYERIEQELDRQNSPFGLGHRRFFPPPESGPALRQLSGGTLLAAVASRSIVPGPGDLPERPDCVLLRALSGRSRPPLAGWGGRLQTHLPSLATRLLLRDQYYAHLFRESREAPADSLTNQVKVLVLQGTLGEKFYWVKTDMIGAFQDLRAEILVRARARKLVDLHDGNLLLHGTHTHSGPGALNTRLIPQLATIDLFAEPFFDFVVGQIVDAVLEADRGLVPARLGLGSGELKTITRNRRAEVACRDDPEAPDPDPDVGIVRIDDVSGNPLATVVNFAIHATSLGDDNLEFSPDNVGYAEQHIEAETGAMALFFNGAEGDVAPRKGLSAECIARQLDRAECIGEQLGRAAVAERESIVTSPNVQLRFAYCQLDADNVSLDFPRPCPHNLERFEFRPFKFVEDPREPGCFLDRDESMWSIPIGKTEDPPFVEREGVVLGAFRIDTPTAKAVVLTLPGEPISEIGTNLKQGAQALGFDHAWVFSLSNALMGYIATEQVYHEGGYEGASNMFGPSAGAVFTNISLGLTGQVADEGP